MAGKANEGGEENENARGVESSPLEKAKQIAATMCRQHKETHWLGVRMENFLRAYQQKLEGVTVTGGADALIVPHIFVDASESDPVLDNSLVPNSLVKTALCHFCCQQMKKISTTKARRHKDHCVRHLFFFVSLCLCGRHLHTNRNGGEPKKTVSC